MDIVKAIIVAIHLISVAAIIGGWFARFKSPTVTTSQWFGALGMIITGLILYGLAEMDGDPNRIKLTIKLVLGLIVFVTALIGRRKVNKGEAVPTGLAHGVGGLALINLLVAALWI